METFVSGKIRWYLNTLVNDLTTTLSWRILPIMQFPIRKLFLVTHKFSRKTTWITALTSCRMLQCGQMESDSGDSVECFSDVVSISSSCGSMLCCKATELAICVRKMLTMQIPRNDDFFQWQFSMFFIFFAFFSWFTFDFYYKQIGKKFQTITNCGMRYFSQKFLSYSGN